jgi:rod shape-determining protein MreD
MRRFVSLLLAGIILLILQTTWLSFFPIPRIRPDLLLIFTLYLAFFFRPFLGGILAFFMGYLMDLFSGNTLGFYTFSRTLVFFATQFLKERFYLEGFSFQFLFAFIFGILEGGLLFVLIHGLEPVSFENLYLSLFTFLLPQSFCTGLAAPLLFFLFKKAASLLFHQSEQGINARGRA